MKYFYWGVMFVASTFFLSCSDSQSLVDVTTADFSEFVAATGYITDAERYGWSIVQKTVYTFETVEGATWRKPDGLNEARPNYPVTQVSYNDAVAYCKWAKVTLPSYEMYWKLIKSDDRSININANSIRSAEQTNTVGNTWDITTSINAKNETRLAGGSYLCSKNTCDGTNKNRELFVSLDTGNSHISFCVVVD